MTDDPTQQYDTPPSSVPAPPAIEAATPAPGSGAPGMGSQGPATTAAVAPVVTGGSSKARWVVALGVAGIAIAVAIGALLLFSKTSAPEALAYIPGDAALVMEVRMDLPGDQLQAAGNLLAHFPGFQDQSTLPQKIDESLRRAVEAGGSGVNYDTEVKPFISGPLFVGVQSFADMAESSDPKNFVVVATTNGALSCATAFPGVTLVPEDHNGVQVSVGNSGHEACAVDGRFFLVGDAAGVAGAIDAHKATTGMDKSARYQAARTQLGLDRLATLYVDGTAIARALPSADPDPAVARLANTLPEWIMAGIRAENDALVLDLITAPPPHPVPLPSTATLPPVHPIAFTAFAPADTLIFTESQGFGVQVTNLVSQLQGDPQFAEALQQLDQFGGVTGLIGWVDEAGVVVFRDGETPEAGILLAANDAATASAKVGALEALVGLGALGGEFDVSTSTVDGVKVTTIHLPDVGSMAGVPTGTPVPLDVSFGAKDKVVLVGIGTNAMAKMLGVQPGASLADDPAFKRALARGLANPQVVIYVAAGAAIDWLDTAAAAVGGPGIPADAKAYLDPVEGFIYTVTGNGVNGSFRMALTVANP